jgi:hypothetical protein
LSHKQKERINKHIEEHLDHAGSLHHRTFVYEALAYGATGPDLPPFRDRSYEVYGEEYWVYILPAQTLAIAIVSQFQVVTSHSYTNFHSIYDLRQVLLDRCLMRPGVPSIEPHLRKVHQTSSWDGGAPATLHHIPPDDEIKGLYDIYINRHIPAPAPSDSSTDSLFGEDDYE